MNFHILAPTAGHLAHISVGRTRRRPFGLRAALVVQSIKSYIHRRQNIREGVFCGINCGFDDIEVTSLSVPRLLHPDDARRS